MQRTALVALAIGLSLSGALALKTETEDGSLLQTIGVLEVAYEDMPKVPQIRHNKGAFPVPTTARCIIILVVQFMITYTCLAVCRTYHEFSGSAKGPVEDGLRAAAQTLIYAPMICVLFIACRMRVEFLSEGNGQPQLWVQTCMYAVTLAVLISALLVLFLPLLVGRPLPLRQGTCDLERPAATAEDDKVSFYVVSGLRYLIMLGLYGGLAGVIVGICTYLPPGAKDLTKVPAPASAVMCTMILAVVFFSTQLVIAVCRTYTEFRGVEFPKIVTTMTRAAGTVELAPMLSIVFLAARMRALQHDGQPQAWAQQCMYVATASMCMQTLLSLVLPLLLEGTVATTPRTKQTLFVVRNPTGANIMIALRLLCTLGFYGSVVGVICSIFTFVAPAGSQATLPVSPTVQCVVNLTCQFFFVRLALMVCETVSELSGGRFPLETYKFYSAVEASKVTLAFAPMLSMLFVTTRMYALLITDKKGAPQAWVQDGMYMATWSLFLCFLSCLLTGLVMDEVQTDEDGNVMNKFSDKYIAVAMTSLRYVTMFFLYGGIVTVVVGLFVMTPETANGRGSLPLVSDVLRASPVGDAPPGPNDVANAGAEAWHAVTKAGK